MTVQTYELNLKFIYADLDGGELTAQLLQERLKQVAAEVVHGVTVRRPATACKLVSTQVVKVDAKGVR